ncbi:hypothetical protein [Rickettsia hoogstraalii]|uniref:hypothetical protein n=1 Tax=Rickettsia hoogstraalii TaxID=467174 RepID=UPI0012E0A23C|nr:hypothetical protein [Rickettsia hoogstraalii]
MLDILCYRYCEWALLRGPAFPSLREELRSNSTKQSSKILIYRIFLLFFLDCRVASLLAMTEKPIHATIESTLLYLFIQVYPLSQNFLLKY